MHGVYVGKKIKDMKYELEDAGASQEEIVALIEIIKTDTEVFAEKIGVREVRFANEVGRTFKFGRESFE